MAKVTRQANTACRTRPLQATQPADSPPGTGLITNSQQLAGLAAKQQLPTKLACLSPCSAGKWGSAVVLAQEGGCRPTYPISNPPIAFASHCPYPLP